MPSGTPFPIPLQLNQLLLPPVCSGVLLIATALFFYASLRARTWDYISTMLLGLMGMVFTGSEALILFVGGWLRHAQLGMQFHRLEQVAGAFFLFGLPFFLAHHLILNRTWKRAHLIMSGVGAAAALVITAVAYVEPDLFISITRHAHNWTVEQSTYGRGQTGVVMPVRDLMLAVYIFYAAVIMTVELVWHRDFRYTLLAYIGLLISIYAAVIDIYQTYTHELLPPFSESSFSRFSLGITIFIVMAMAGVLRRFLDQSRELVNTYYALNKSEQRFRQIAGSINEVFWLIDLRTGKVLYINRVFEKLWDMSCQRLSTEPAAWLEQVCAADRSYVQRRFRELTFQNGDTLEYRIHSADGSLRWIEDTFFQVSEDNMQTNLVRLSNDITERKESQRHLSYLAYHDTLTRLPNRKHFSERFDDLLRQKHRDHGPSSLALVLIDIDQFKLLNDTYSHDICDHLLVQVAERLTRAVRRSDYVSRIGSDEFTVLLSQLREENDIIYVSEKLHHELTQPYALEGREIELTVSIGIAVWPRDGENRSELMKRADMALNEAKKNRNCLHFFTSDMQDKALERLTLAKALRQALRREELELYYQPQLGLGNQVVGSEALLRWRHDDRLISPLDFIPIAEETGLIHDIGEWVLLTACEQQRVWHEAGYNHLKVAVNLSPRQFRQPKLLDRIKGILRDSGLDNRSLDLELTESTLLENIEEAARKMKWLTDRGIHFSIDDFGTGYSSLSYLQRLPFYNLKIDQSFIRAMHAHPNNYNLVAAIVGMAHTLNIQTTAEGVETQRQADDLRQLTCSKLQGFLYSRPLPAAAMDRFLQENGSRL